MDRNAEELLLDAMLEQLSDDLLYPILESTGIMFAIDEDKQSFTTVSTGGIIQFDAVYRVQSENTDVTLTMKGLLGNARIILGTTECKFDDRVLEACYWDKLLFFLPGDVPNELVFSWEVPSALTCGSLALDWSLIGIKFELCGYTPDKTHSVRGNVEVNAEALRRTYAEAPWNSCRPVSLDKEQLLTDTATEQGFWL